jgi:hypothetical protein
MKKERSLWANRSIKISPALIVFLIAVGLSYFLPDEGDKVTAQIGIMSLMITRMISVSMGFAFAYIVKEISFPYLSLTKSIKEHHWAAVIFTAIWYAVCIYCFSMGG